MRNDTATDEPTRAHLWKRSALFASIGLILAVLLAVRGHWLLAIPVAVLALFMTYWVSPTRRGLHTPWTSALEKQGPGHAIIIWSPVDRGSAQLQVGIRADDPHVTWVNYMHDAEAHAFAQQHGGYSSLPIAVVGDTVLTCATSGDVINARA